MIIDKPSGMAEVQWPTSTGWVQLLIMSNRPLPTVLFRQEIPAVAEACEALAERITALAARGGGPTEGDGGE